ncbi:hypothetical protein HY947_01475 [Candidatus Gottesmanbacteria bacterium]|nr:hypothetical protein [Candidatus Gottesmanbacteria bacterium]
MTLPGPQKIQKPPKIEREDEEKLMAIMRQIESSSFDKMDSEHITEVLAQRRQVREYIHEENMQEHERFKILQKNGLVHLIIIILFALIILLMVVFVDKSYFPQAITLIIGFLGGFGVGKSIKDPQKNEN